MAQSCISSRQLITSLVDQLAATKATNGTSNPLASAEEDDKNILLTLYATFPKELPFALDLLDRRLVHCFYLQDNDEAQQQAQDRPSSRGLGSPNTAGSSTHATVDQDQARCDQPATYEHEHESVHRQAEAATTQSEHLPAIPDSRVKGLYYVRSAQHHARSRYKDDNPSHYEVRLTAWSCSCPAFSLAAFPPKKLKSRRRGQNSFGGMSLSDSMPICKHLLACYLADRCPQFMPFVNDKRGSLAEMAGWAAGWGD